MRFALAAVLAGLVTFAPNQADPRAAGVLTGVVVDIANAAVVGATVQLRAGARVERTAATDARGAFRFDKLLPASYDIVVTKAGFAPLTSTVAVVNGKPASVRLTLTGASSKRVVQDSISA